ncbi:FAD:protein FMN transferase [Paracoccaceae bacterium GXU_MW_L88]
MTPLLFSRRTFLAMPLALAACKKGWSVLELSGLTMGTTYNVIAVDHSKDVAKADLQAAVNTRLAAVNTQMSNWDSGSEISKFNASTGASPMRVSPELAHVMKAAQDVNMASDGRFDVTVGPLIDLWGFGAGQTRSTMPTDAEIADAMACCGQAESLRVSDSALQKLNPNAEIYLSAIGKGFGVDQVARAMKDFGIKDYMVEIGGDLYTAGKNPDGQPWHIGIETPEAYDRNVQQVVDLSNLGMATSGDYRNFFDYEGQRYSHIIDATTGRPVTHSTASVTVLAENAMLADAWATALLVMGRDRGLEVANQRNLAALFIDRSDANAHNGFTTSASDQFTALQA